MAAGRASVASAVGDLREVLERYPAGLLARDAPGALASAALALLADPPRRIAMERVARRTAEEIFDWRLRAADLEQFYHMVTR